MLIAPPPSSSKPAVCPIRPRVNACRMRAIKMRRGPYMLRRLKVTQMFPLSKLPSFPLLLQQVQVLQFVPASAQKTSQKGLGIRALFELGDVPSSGPQGYP
ncbi:hypothetical protein FF1_013883 [Malus domestica]